MGNQLGVPARPTPDMVAEVPGLVFKEALGESGVTGWGRQANARGTAPTPHTQKTHTPFAFPLTQAAAASSSRRCACTTTPGWWWSRQENEEEKSRW